MKRTYVDANILIAAFKGEGGAAQRALQVLDDPDSKLVVSDYVRLEVLPKPTFHNRQEEIGFMQAVLEDAENLSTSSELTGSAVTMASRYDLTPIDSLHVSASVVAAVDQLVTMEKPSKPMCKVNEVKVVSIHSESEDAQ